MSIAELIMTGTERASKSTDWVADSLAKIGDNVSKVLTEREQNRQAQEMLPFLKQNLQAAMTDAENGKPGQAYSKLLGSLDTQTLKNPQLADFVKLGFNAINQTMDAQKTGGTSLVDFLVAKELGLPLPTGGGGVGGGAGGTGGSQDVGTPDVPAQIVTGVEIINAPGMEYVDTTQGISAVPNKQFSVPVQGKDNKTYYAQPRMEAIPVDGGTELIDNPAPWTPTKGNAQQQPTPEQEEARAFLQKNQKVAETQGTGKAWYNESVSEDSPKLKELDQTHDQLYFKGADQFQFGTMYFPKEKDLDKEIKITAKGNDFNFSVDRNKVNTDLEKERRAFKINITTALERMQSQEIDKLFKEYGSIENFPLPSRGDPKAIKFPIKGKDGKPSFVKLPISGQPDPDGVIKNMGLGDAFTLLQSAPGLGRPIGILIARSGEMPPVGGNRAKENLAEILQ